MNALVIRRKLMATLIVLKLEKLHTMDQEIDPIYSTLNAEERDELNRQDEAISDAIFDMTTKGRDDDSMDGVDSMDGETATQTTETTTTHGN